MCFHSFFDPLNINSWVIIGQGFWNCLYGGKIPNLDIGIMDSFDFYPGNQTLFIDFRVMLNVCIPRICEKN